jgi:3-oxoacyl-(acyl-carrier-protein) synthase
MNSLATGHGFPNVVVTGIAMTTSVASNADDTWKALLDGQSDMTCRYVSAAIYSRTSTTN